MLKEKLVLASSPPKQISKASEQTLKQLREIEIKTKFMALKARTKHKQGKEQNEIGEK